jgi:hypothetical protein
MIPTTKLEINEILHDHMVNVKFTKVNGTIRNMKATLMPEVVNKISRGATGSTRTVPDHQICCIDTEINEWRSFTIDSIIEFNVNG